MSIKIRYLSLLLRRWNSRKERERTLRNFEEWRGAQRCLPPPHPRQGRLLIIRLDDIGDYLLFRNQLLTYKKSARWKDHFITLLGNSSWKELFDSFDQDAVDATVWVRKGEYLTSAAYRAEVWSKLRGQGFETVIAPSRTRPLLLDDLCVLAAAPTLAIGSMNTYVHPAWNEASDPLYHELFRPSQTTLHEFQFNGEFAAWISGNRYEGARPRLDTGATSHGPGSHIICFLGANTRSRRWPAERWVEFIQLYRRQHPGPVILAGSGRAEFQLAAAIQARTDARSIVGKATLIEFVRWVSAAKAVLTNDTMAGHLAVSCARPTVIIANGVNYQRFTEYGAAGIKNVVTVYPSVFTRRRERFPNLSYHYTDALTSDIASISARRVFAALEESLREDDRAN